MQERHAHAIHDPPVVEALEPVLAILHDAEAAQSAAGGVDEGVIGVRVAEAYAHHRPGPAVARLLAQQGRLGAGAAAQRVAEQERRLSPCSQGVGAGRGLDLAAGRGVPGVLGCYYLDLLEHAQLDVGALTPVAIHPALGGPVQAPGIERAALVDRLQMLEGRAAAPGDVAADQVGELVRLGGRGESKGGERRAGRGDRAAFHAACPSDVSMSWAGGPTSSRRPGGYERSNEMPANRATSSPAPSRISEARPECFMQAR